MSAEEIAAAKEARMRWCHERNERLRASASLVKLHEEQPYRNEKGEGTYTESKTAKMLRERFGE